MSDIEDPDPAAQGRDEVADEEFERVLRNLVNTPHKPHSEKREPGKPDPRPVSGEKRPKGRE